MAEHLLDGPQIGPAVEQMRRERVTEGVRVDASLDRGVPRPHAQATPYIRCREPSTGLRQEQRLLAAAIRERRARALHVARKRAQGRLAGRDDPGFRALAFHTHFLSLVVDRARVE